MKNLKLTAVAAVTALSFGVMGAENISTTINVGDNAKVFYADDIKMYDELEAGKAQNTQRYIVALTPLENEHDAKVELRFKKTAILDCNARNLATNIIEKTVDGWGYNYYVAKIGGIQSTMMMCNAEATEKTLYSTPQPLIRYNSKLPLVIYAPVDTELEVRIWRPSKAYQK